MLLLNFCIKKLLEHGIFKDIEKIQKLSILQEKKKKELEGICSEDEIQNEINKVVLENMDDFLEATLQLTYVLILTANKDVESFENWLKGIKQLNINSSWIGEVTEFAVSSFLR